ncbi:hypothetical protein [Metamycoplasma hominis]|uniref:hypothetical protein n=1 Tax=Metamycoplasma hominis TaxID=2098 RepID=UPI0022AA97FF|nr:hypothetical protein [Metamycoplasma hominis]MCZ2781472.1 hypothetical protein [Metamycoplasma hominis]
MKKKLNILLSISLIAAAASTAAIASVCASKNNKFRKQRKYNKETAKQEINQAKENLKKLLELIKSSDIDKTNELKVLDNSKIDENSSIEDIQNKTQEIEKAIESLTKKINDKNKKHEEDQKLVQAMQEFKKSQKALGDLINSEDGQRVDNSNAKQSLQNNAVNNKSSIEQIIQAVSKINKAKQELQSQINNARNQAKEVFEEKKQQLNKLIKSSEIDNSKKADETAILKNTNVVVGDSIKTIETKTKEIEKAIESLTNKINEFKKEQEKATAKAVFAKKSKQLKDLIDSEDGKKVDSSNESQVLTKTKIDENSSIEDIQNKTKDIEKAIESLTNKINDQKQQKNMLNEVINKVKELVKKLIDSDSEIQQAKTQLDQEIQKASQVVNSNDTKAMNSSKTSLDAKIDDIAKKLEAFNATKKLEFTKLQETRSNIDKFLTPEVKANPNYTTLVNELEVAKKAKELVSESSNKSDIIVANNELKQALQTAQSSKNDADKTSSEEKAKLSASLSNAKELDKNLTDSDGEIQQAKAELAKEVEKANQAITSNNTKEIQNSNTSLLNKISEVKNKLDKFNNEKEAEFNKLEASSSAIKEFINENNTNPNYTALIQKLQAKLDAKNSITKSSNKLDIVAANQTLQEALAIAKTEKESVNSQNQAIKNTLNETIGKAKELDKNLTDSDGEIQQAKTELTNEIEKANQAIASNNTASMEGSNTSLLNKISEVQNKLDKFNNDKKAEFNKLQELKNKIDDFEKKNKNNEIYSKFNLDELINKSVQIKNSLGSINESSNKKDIVDANKKMQDALNELQAKMAEIHKKTFQEFNEHKNELENLIKKEDAKEVGTDEANTAITNNDVKENSSIEEITKANKALDEAKSKLDQKINTQKATELNSLNESKEKLNNLITSSSNQVSAEEISKAKKVLEEINNLSLNNDSSIKSLKEATQKIKDVETQLTKEIEKAKIEKTDKLKKFNEVKKSLEDLIKDDDAIQVGTDDAPKLLEDNNNINENSSIEEIINATKTLEDGKSKLDKKIKTKKQPLIRDLKRKVDDLSRWLEYSSNSEEHFAALDPDKRPKNITLDTIKKDLEDARRLLQEANKLNDDSKIANINKKIDEIKELNKKTNLWKRAIEYEYDDLMHKINGHEDSIDRYLKIFESNENNREFVTKLKTKVEKIKELYKKSKSQNRKKVAEYLKNLLILSRLLFQYNYYCKIYYRELPATLQEKLIKEFEKILDKDGFTSDSEIAELENKSIELMIAEDPKIAFTILQKQTKDLRELVQIYVKESPDSESNNFHTWMNNSLKTIEDKYNSALEKKDENALKIEIIKMENFYKLIKTFASYLSEITSIRWMMNDDNKKEEVSKKAIECAKNALNDLASQDISNKELISKKVTDIKNEFYKAYINVWRKFCLND